MAAGLWWRAGGSSSLLRCIQDNLGAEKHFHQTAVSQQRRMWPQSVLQLTDLLQASRLFAPSPCGQHPSDQAADKSRLTADTVVPAGSAQPLPAFTAPDDQ